MLFWHMANPIIGHNHQLWHYVNSPAIRENRDVWRVASLEQCYNVTPVGPFLLVHIHVFRVAEPPLYWSLQRCGKLFDRTCRWTHVGELFKPFTYWIGLWDWNIPGILVLYHGCCCPDWLHRQIITSSYWIFRINGLCLPRSDYYFVGTMDPILITSGVCFNNVSRALQNNLTRICNARYYMYG